MATRIAEQPAFRLVGHTARVPLIHHGPNPHIQAHIASLPEAEHLRLKALSDAIEVPAGTWAVFRTSGPYPAALQSQWAATASDWFPSNPWRLRPGPSVVAIL